MFSNFVSQWRAQKIFKALSGERREIRDWYEANIISSQMLDGKHHKPLIDIDLPVYVYPSTNSRHSHLYIDKELSWEDYKKILRVLAEVGIVQEGYYRASLERGATHLRLPWIIKKENDGLSTNSDHIHDDGNTAWEKEIPLERPF